MYVKKEFCFGCDFQLMYNQVLEVYLYLSIKMTTKLKIKKKSQKGEIKFFRVCLMNDC